MHIDEHFSVDIQRCFSSKAVSLLQGKPPGHQKGSKYNWGFAANQYDYVGNVAGNTSIDSQASGAVVDLFYWSTSATTYGISKSTSNSDYS